LILGLPFYDLIKQRFMTISRQKVQDMYQSGAKHYDFTTILFRLIGLRMKAYRLIALRKLSIKRGDYVIELGCGTGLNFSLLMERIGPEGRLIGIDLYFIWNCSMKMVTSALTRIGKSATLLYQPVMRNVNWP
jgi:demethylmenaquinone methyltransferase/2-methoxy-6-polyprenyl-1,4-benzoquinol methylase